MYLKTQFSKPSSLLDQFSLKLDMAEGVGSMRKLKAYYLESHEKKDWVKLALLDPQANFLLKIKRTSIKQIRQSKSFKTKNPWQMKMR